MACMVLSGLFAYSVQGILLAVILGVLLGKWLLEWRFKPSPRTLLVFTLDSSKQLVGAGWVHLTNIAFSELLAKSGGDECQWYLINIVLDATLGSALEYILLMVMYRCLERICGADRADDWIESGNYYDMRRRLRPCKYLKQLLIWVLFVVTIMKVTMVGTALVFKDPLTRGAATILRPFQADAHQELLFVMVIAPSAANALQFWLGDGIVRSRLRRPAREAALTASTASSEAAGGGKWNPGVKSLPAQPSVAAVGEDRRRASSLPEAAFDQHVV